MPIVIVLFSLTILLLGVSLFYFQTGYRNYQRMKRSHQVEIAVLGPTGVGKTTFLATLLKQLTEPHDIDDVLVGKYLSDDEEKTLRELGTFQKDSETGYYTPGKRATHQLVKTELGMHRRGQGLGTREPESLYLEILEPKSDESTHRQFLWRDIPGGFFEVQGQWRFNGLAESLARAHGIYLLVDSSALYEQEKSLNKAPSHESSEEFHLNFRNYVEAISYRLKLAEKRKEKFPVWVILTKGDLLPQEVQERSAQEWMKKISQVAAIFNLTEDMVKSFVTLISIHRQKDGDDLYHKISHTMKEFHQVIGTEMAVKNKILRKKSKRALIGAFAASLLFTLSLVEATAAYRFMNLPLVDATMVIQDEQALEISEKITRYLRGYGSIGFSSYYQKQAQMRLQVLQNVLGQLMQQRVESLDLSRDQYRTDLVVLLQQIETTRNNAQRINYWPVNFVEIENFTKKLKVWDQLRSQGASAERLLAFNQGLPSQMSLKKQIQPFLAQKLGERLDYYNQEAESYSGQMFHPQRLESIWLWHPQFASFFPSLDQKFFEHQRYHWQYVWKRYLALLNDQVDDLEKAKLLRDFREKIPNKILSYCPDDILRHWEKLVDELLARWEAESDPIRKSQQESLQSWFLRYRDPFVIILNRSQHFEEKIEQQIAQLYQLEKKDGEKKKEEILALLKSFLQEHSEEKISEQAQSWQKVHPELFQSEKREKIEQNKTRIRSFVERWTLRQEELKSFFQETHSAIIVLKEYGTEKAPLDVQWNDEWLESFHLALRLEIGENPPIPLNINEGNLSYQGNFLIPRIINWSHWDDVTVRFLDVDDKIDQEALVDDDELAGISFKTTTSLFDLTAKKLEIGDEDSGKYWFRANLQMVMPVANFVLSEKKASKKTKEESLRTALAEQGLGLSAEASLVEISPTLFWEITDREKKYYLHQNASKFVIYEPRSFLPNWLKNYYFNSKDS